MTAIFIYENTVSHWIQLCKYHGALVEQRVSATLMAQSLASTAKTVDLIIPVPLSKRRLWQRGHNQSLGLARIISRHLGISLHHSSLKRIRHTPPQQRLSRSRRLKNLKGAFVACPTVAGKTVALIDDVVTTQTTAVEATLALLSAGAKEVHVWALARVLR
jgi:ComF family protein